MNRRDVTQAVVTEHAWVTQELIRGALVEMPEHCSQCGQLRQASGNNRFCAGHVPQLMRPQPAGPTTAARFNRMSPLERHEVKALLKTSQLRRAVRSTLVEAFHSRAPQVETFPVVVR